jgi:NAD+ synthase
MRMVLLYLYGEIENRLVVGAANKSEYLIGYFVKHGCDDATDIMPLLNLYKTQVRDLARFLNIPSRIIEKPPSPDIVPGIVDEDVIGIPYEKLDLILLALEKGWEGVEIAKALDIEEERVVFVKNLAKKSEHMRKIYSP